jgi:biopolymer transport protein TolR
MAFYMPGNGSLRAEINITPLIDVLLVLIIVFMVVVSMSQKKGLDAQIPQPAQDAKQSPPIDGTIVIQLVWGGKDRTPLLKINQDEVSWNDLHGRLQDIFKQRAERVAFVKGDAEVDFEYVADVIDIARNAGVDRVGLLTKE